MNNKYNNNNWIAVEREIKMNEFFCFIHFFPYLLIISYMICGSFVVVVVLSYKRFMRESESELFYTFSI